MSEVRIIAVSFQGGEDLQHITHLWTAGGAVATRQAAEDLWKRRCSYYTVSPNGRVPVRPVPARAPGLLAAVMGKTTSVHLRSEPSGQSNDSLLTLPRLLSPNRGRRSQQLGEAAESMVSRV